MLSCDASMSPVLVRPLGPGTTLEGWEGRQSQIQNCRSTLKPVINFCLAFWKANIAFGFGPDPQVLMACSSLTNLFSFIMLTEKKNIWNANYEKKTMRVFLCTQPPKYISAGFWRVGILFRTPAWARNQRCVKKRKTRAIIYILIMLHSSTPTDISACTPVAPLQPLDTVLQLGSKPTKKTFRPVGLTRASIFLGSKVQNKLNRAHGWKTLLTLINITTDIWNK